MIIITLSFTITHLSLSARQAFHTTKQANGSSSDTSWVAPRSRNRRRGRRRAPRSFTHEANKCLASCQELFYSPKWRTRRRSFWVALQMVRNGNPTLLWGTKCCDSPRSSKSETRTTKDEAFGSSGLLGRVFWRRLPPLHRPVQLQRFEGDRHCHPTHP